MQHSRVLAALVQSLGHALASPLALIRGRAELISRAGADAKAAENAGRIIDQVDLVVALLERIRTFAAALETTARTPVRDQLEAAREACTLRLEIAPAACELSGELPEGSLQALLSGLEAFALVHGGQLAIEPAQASGSPGLQLTLSLPADAALPASRAALSDPWLEAPTADATARFELALALGVLHRCGGSCERRLEPVPELRLFLPIQG